MTARGVAPFTFDRSFRFDVPRSELWARISQTERFVEWWRWLRRLESPDPQLVEGTQATCIVRGPLPYELRLTIAVHDVVPEQLVTTSVDGDLRGPARLEVSGDDGSSEARLVWRLEVVDPALRSLTRVARPLMSWGHDVVVSRGLRQFKARALEAG